MTFAPGLQQIVDAHKELTASAHQLAQDVSFTVTTETRSSEPIQAARGRLADSKLDDYRPREPARDRAIQRLEKLGFRIVRVGRFGVTVSGPAPLVREVLGEPLMLMRQATQAPIRAALAFTAETTVPDPHELFLAPASSLSVQPKVGAEIDHFVFAPPAMLFARPPPRLQPRAITVWEPRRCGPC